MKLDSLKRKYLFLKVQKKDPEAFGELYDIYIDKIFRFVYFKISSFEESQDLAADVFLKLWQEIIKEKKIENLNALIYTIARNLVIDHFRQKQRQDINFSQIDFDELNMIKDNIDQKLIKQIDLSQEVEQVHQALWKLKDEYREVIILRYINEYSNAEISEILNKKKGAVKVMLHRAVKNLQDYLSKNEKNTN